MTPDPLTPEEKYRYEERLAISCGDGVPSQVDEDLALGDVRRFRREMKDQNDTN